MQRGISLRLDDLAAFTRSLQRVFLQTSETSDWIGNLANHDVRRTLNLVRTFVGSPHLHVDDLIKAHLAGSALEVSNSRAARALIRGHYDVYPAGQHDFVQNVFALNEVPPTTPLLGVRVLQLLADVPQREHHGAVIEVSEIVAYCTGMNLDSRPVLLWLDSLLKTGLLLNYDPTVQDIGQATRVELSPAGRQHLHWAMGNLEYLGAMSEVTPLLAEGTYRTMQARTTAARWRERTSVFLTYLLQEDAMYVSLPEHDAYASQRRITSNLEVLARQLNSTRGRPPASARSGAPAPGKRR